MKGKKTQVSLAKELGVSLGCVQYWHGIRERRGVKGVFGMFRAFITGAGS